MSSSRQVFNPLGLLSALEKPRKKRLLCLQILPHFPRVVKLGKALMRRVERVSKDEKEKRPDISALAYGSD